MRPPLLGAGLAVALLAAVPAAHAHVRGDVAALQVALRALGHYGGTVDGLRGPATTAAVTAFQRRRGLPADGVAGRQTRRALGRRGRPAWGSRVLRRGARGWDVAVLQFLLARRGFPSGPLDGGFGERTRAALLRYQRWAGLVADGAAGPGTRRSLRRPPPSVRIALRRPVAAPLGDLFGPRGARFHTGIDFPAPAGTTVRAAHAGVVASAGWHAGGYGRLVVLAHPGGTRTWYAHLARIDVAPGRQVDAGTPIGLVGSTGASTGPHLHFEARDGTAAADPLPALR